MRGLVAKYQQVDKHVSLETIRKTRANDDGPITPTRSPTGLNAESGMLDSENEELKLGIGYQGKEKVFTLVIYLIASITPSLIPSPESLTPPKGEHSIR